MQKCVNQSTAEVESYSAFLVTQEIIWVRRLLKELDLPEEVPTPLLEDNNACIKMIENPVVSKHNKHIETKIHFIRDHYKGGAIKPRRISTYNQLADLMTKNLGRKAHQRHTRNLLSTRTRHSVEGECRNKYRTT